MPDCAFCGSADVELATTSFAETRGRVTIQVDGEPAVTFDMAKAVQAAFDLIFAEIPASEQILTVAAGQDAHQAA